jgi:ABC-type sugar transport system substrate-binding protein
MKKLRFLVSLMTKSNDYQMEQANSAVSAARQLGADIEVVFADNDAITQSTQALKAIQVAPEVRPDAIIVEPVGGTALPQVAKAAAEAGIGWAILNREADYLTEIRRKTRVPMFSISVDHKEIGKIQGQQFCALLPRGGSLLYIQGPSENSAAKERALGMQSTLRPDIQVTVLRGQWTEESAYKCVTSWLKLNIAHKVNVNLIGAQNDSMAIGARKAFQDVANAEERDQWLKLPITGVDGVPQTGQSWVRSGSLRATVIVPPDAGQAITMLSQALQYGTGVPERSYTVPVSYPTLDRLIPRT